MLPRNALLMMTALAALPAAAQQQPRGDQDLMILAVRLDGDTLTESLTTYVSSEGVLVPVGELSQLLGLAIAVRAEEGIAEGWAFNEQRRFLLHLGTLTASFDGNAHVLSAGEVQLQGGELFIDARVLAKVLPLDLVMDLREATITVRPREPLPLQKQRERLRKMQAASRGQPSLFQAPDQTLSYSAFKLPSVDQSITTTAVRGQSEEVRTDLQYSTYATGELLYLQTDVYLAGTANSLPQARLHMGRKDPDGKLLGPLGATDVGAGDVSFPGQTLVSRASAGLGVHLSNRPLHNPTHYDRHTFRGELAPGWEVELYRNGALIAYQAARPDGRYEFVDVPLLFGMNAFRIVSYGPQGQQRESQETFNVDSGAVPPGETYYRLTGTVPAVGGRRTLLEVDTGLTQNVSASASMATVLREGRDRVYAHAGLKGFYGVFSGSVDGVQEVNGGRAAQARVRAQMWGMRLAVEHAQLFDFDSEFFDGAPPLRARSAVRLDGQPRPFGAFNLPLSLELRRDWLLTQGHQTQLLANTAVRVRHFSLSHQLQVGIAADNALTPTGQAMAAMEFSRVALRAGAAYVVRPDWALSNVSVGVESRGFELLSVSASATRSQTDTIFQASAGKSHGIFGLALGGSYATSGTAAATLTLSIAFKHDEREGGWRVQRNAAGSGAASARVFLDSNGNGTMDADEKPLPDVQLDVNGRGADMTNEEGVAVLSTMTPYSPANIRLVEGSLEDPYLQPSTKGVRVVPRPGRMAVVELPVQMTGEVVGTLFVSRGDQRRQMPGVEVEVVSATGELHKTRSAYDGFYNLPQLRPGKYTVRVSPTHLASLGFNPPAPRSVEILPDGTFVDGLDFVVEDPRPVMLASVQRGATGAQELVVPTERGAVFELPAAGGTLRVRVIEQVKFALASWAAGLPLSPEESAALDKIGSLALASPKHRVLIVSNAQTLGAAAGAVKRATRGAGQLQRYLKAVQFVPSKRVTVNVKPPREGGEPLGSIELYVVELVDGTVEQSSQQLRM